MYESFLLDLPPSDRELNIQWMAEACGKPKEQSRACFAACVSAIGGNFISRGSKTFCVNIRSARAPVFA